MACGRTFRGILAVVVALGVTGAAWAQRPGGQSRKSAQAVNPDVAAPDFSRKPSYQVARIVDSNSLVVMVDGRTQTVRLIGVDSPQAVSSLPKAARTRLAKEATQYLTTQLQGKTVYVDEEAAGQGQLDDAGRVLGYVYRAPDGLLVNKDLIAKGHAIALPQRTYSQFDAFRAEEKQAKASKLGLWADSDGTLADKKDKPGDAESETFAVQKNSKKYHRTSCRLVTKDSTSITLAEVKEKKLEPCLVCKPDQAVATTNTAKTAATNTGQKSTRKKKQYQSQSEQRRLLNQNMPVFNPGDGDVSPY